MEVKVTGDPGEGNTYSETHVNDGGGYYPAAQTVNNNYYGNGSTTRMAAYFQRLLDEIKKDVRQETFDELDFYQTKLAGTKDVEEKLVDGGFRPAEIDAAVRLKDYYAKKATRYDCYPSAQQIIYNLLGRIKHEFDTYIFPLIQRGESLTVVRQQIRERIVSPIMQTLEVSGAYDRHLNFSEDHIYGMIYYLTGMCHLNWTDYDNV